MAQANDSPYETVLSKFEARKWTVDYEKLSARAMVSLASWPQTMQVFVGFDLLPETERICYGFSIHGPECEAPAAQPFIERLGEWFNTREYALIQTTSSNVQFQWYATYPLLFSEQSSKRLNFEIDCMYQRGLDFVCSFIHILSEYTARSRRVSLLSQRLPGAHQLVDFCLLGFDGKHFNA